MGEKDGLCGQAAPNRRKCLHSALSYKWLEEGRFVFPKIQDGAMVLTGPELSVLLAGLDWMNIDAKVVKRPLRTG